MSNTLKNKISFVVIVFFAFAVRVQGLASAPTYLDEYSTIIKYVALPVLDIFRASDSNNHPLASFLAHLCSPNGDNYFLMRWPMLCLGILSLPLVYSLITSFSNHTTALITIFLLAMSPYHLAFSTSVRGYTGLILGVTISGYILVNAYSRNGWLDWIGFVTVNLITLYFHLFGLLAVATQLLIFFIIRLNLFSQQSISGIRLLKPIIATLVYAVFSLSLLYTRTHVILSEQGGQVYTNNEFAVWRDGFNELVDVQPLIETLSLLGLMASFQIEPYFYAILAGVGFIALCFKNKIYTLIVPLAFIVPFVAIFIVIQLSGMKFYAYVRFLIYLLPFYLFLVALGITTLLRIFATKNQVIAWVTQYGLIAGLLVVLSISFYNYKVRAAHSDWNGVTNILAQELQPHDIVICQKYQNGFYGLESKTGQPYCMWMLNVPLPQLKAYSSNFEDTLDTIANYNFFSENRFQLNQPGAFWLVLWEKHSYSPHGHLTQQNLPELIDLPPLSEFNPHQVYRLGSTTVVHVNSESTLLENIEQALYLLLKIEPQSANQARYYRSLAEMEALRGDKSSAERFFNLSWHKAEQAGQYPDLFLLDTKPVIDRLPEEFVASSQAVNVGYQIDSSLCLHSYKLSNTTDISESLTITLNWETRDFVSKDYSYAFAFDDKSGNNLGYLEFQPFDRVYPTIWWWPKQKLAEIREIGIPPDLSKQDYFVRLNVYNKETFSGNNNDALFRLHYQSENNNWRIEIMPHTQSKCL